METDNLNKTIQECERLALDTGEPHFVLSWNTLHQIKKLAAENKEDKREADLEEILDEEEYSVGDWSQVTQMPSMEIYYDSVSKQSDKTKRTKWAISQMEKLGFEYNSIFNLLPEDERPPYDHFVYRTKEFSMKMDLEHGDSLNAKISPNLMTTVTHFTTFESSKVSSGHEVALREIYRGYLITADIVEAIAKNVNAESMKHVVRDIKLQDLLD